MAKAKRRAIQPVEVLDTPTEAQLANGDYARDTIIHADTYRRETVYINRGGTPIARWALEGRLTDNQQRAISHCLYLWRLAGTEKRVTANYGERIPGSGDSEHRAVNEIEARDDLHRIMDYIPAPYWNVWENVVRWDEPAGVAGSKLGFGGRSACDRAHQVVCFVADLIAMKERL